MEKPYRDLATYLKETFGCKTVKICLDGGFTCPNRDGTVGYGGCLFCSEHGAGEFAGARTETVEEQISAYFASPRGGRRAGKYIAYFQNFSGTHAAPDVLRATYDAAACDPRIAGLAIATRPDCIDEERAALLATYAARMPVWVELGLQTASHAVASAMHIGCPRGDFLRAAALLSRHGIDCVAHMIVGLPGEGMEENLATLAMINQSPARGIKIHSLYVTEGTGLASLLQSGAYTPLTEEAYVESVVTLLSHLRPDIIVHRLTGDPPKDRLLSPLWAADKRRVLDAIHARLSARGIRQGILWRENA